MKKFTINEFRKRFPDDDACLDKIFELRYSKHPCCPQCSQQTTFKRIPGRRAYQCSDKDCQYQLYPTAGTVFEKTRTRLSDWFFALYLFTSTRNGVSAKELERQLGTTYKTAHRMGHQIRKLMAQGGLAKLSGTIEIDEYHYGGLLKNKHKKVREEIKKTIKGQGYVHKIPVLALLQRDGGIVTAILTPQTVDGLNIKPIISKHVEKGSTIITDGFGAYKGLDASYKHEVVQHSQDEFVRGIYHSNSVEGFFSQLSRTITGTHIHVSRKYLQNYLNECSFRYVNRKQGQFMFDTILSQV